MPRREIADAPALGGGDVIDGIGERERGDFQSGAAEFGGMGLEGAVKLGFQKELAAVEDTAARKQLFDEMVARAYSQTGPSGALEALAFVNRALFLKPVNPEAHYRTTGPEIWEQTGGRVTHFVTLFGEMDGREAEAESASRPARSAA